MPRVCNGCLAASVDAVYGTAPAADTVHDPATCELVPPIAPTLPVTTITIRWEGDPAALDAALMLADGMTDATPYDHGAYQSWRIVRTIILASTGRFADPPRGLGVARATSGGDGAA